MVKLHFDCRDTFRSARLAFSLQRMWIQLIGLVVGLLGYLIVTYIALLSSGEGIKDAWLRYGLLPCFFGSGDPYPWYSWIIFAIGALVFVCVVLITNTAVSRAAYMLMKGNNFYTWREAFRFAIRKAGSVILTPVSLGVMIGFMILGALIIGLLGKIPYVGELGVSLFTIFWFVAGLFVFFMAVVTVVSLFLVPSIIATTDEDAFEAVFQTFSTTWAQPWRFVLYEALVLVVSVVAVGVLAFAVKEGVVITNGLFATFMGNDFINLANNGQAMVQSWILLSQNIVESIYSFTTPLIFFSKEFIFIPDLPVTVQIASYLYAVSLLFIGGWVISYGLATFNVGNTVLYVALRKKKDDENLLERKDKEEEEEEEGEEKDEEGTEGSDAEAKQQKKTSKAAAKTEGEGEMAYCMKCRAKTEIQNSRKVTMKNGRPALKGTCKECGSGVFRILPSS